MKVKALVTFAGVNFGCAEGQTYEIPRNEAERFIREGLVEKVEDDKPGKEEVKKVRKRPVTK